MAVANPDEVAFAAGLAARQAARHGYFFQEEEAGGHAKGRPRQTGPVRLC
jgi:hypothetical protein